MLYALVLFFSLTDHGRDQGEGGGAGALLCSYKRRLGSFCFGLNILKFIIFGGFQKNKYFWGYENFVDIFVVITKFDYVYVSFLFILGSFLKVKVQNGGYFWGW